MVGSGTGENCARNARSIYESSLWLQGRPFMDRRSGWPKPDVSLNAVLGNPYAMLVIGAHEKLDLAVSLLRSAPDPPTH